MTWTPISESDLWDELNAAETRMSVRQKRLWEAIRINPEKWAQSPWGDMGGGFWAVAIIGRTVIWYNDIEDGFNFSRYAEYGRIEDYLCNEDQLEVTLEKILGRIEFGYELGPSAGPPQRGEFPGQRKRK